jgi:hypothetical protein
VQRVIGGGREGSARGGREGQEGERSMEEMGDIQRREGEKDRANILQRCKL